MAYGKIEYNEDGLPMCEICGGFYNRVLVHARQAHNIEEREYKQQFGLDLKKGICSKESATKSRIAVYNNLDQVEKNLEKGAKYRYTEGSEGRTKEMVSAQTKARLKERLKTPEMIAAMTESGRKVGKSGLGNKVRWGK